MDKADIWPPEWPRECWLVSGMCGGGPYYRRHLKIYDVKNPRQEAYEQAERINRHGGEVFITYQVLPPGSVAWADADEPEEPNHDPIRTNA